MCCPLNGELSDGFAVKCRIELGLTVQMASLCRRYATPTDEDSQGCLTLFVSFHSPPPVRMPGSPIGQVASALTGNASRW